MQMLPGIDVFGAMIIDIHWHLYEWKLKWLGQNHEFFAFFLKKKYFIFNEQFFFEFLTWTFEQQCPILFYIHSFAFGPAG